MGLVEQAKERLLIPELWNLRSWPREAGRECYRPYEPADTRKSGSVFSDGKLFKDFKTGELMDAPALLGRVENMSESAACRLFIQLAGVSMDGEGQARLQAKMQAKKRPKPSKTPEREKPNMPALEYPDPGQAEMIEDKRGVSAQAIFEAANRGLFYVTTWKGKDSWAITDSSGWNCQFRRITSQPYEHKGRELKTLGVPKGRGDWPIGAADMSGRENVLLVEGAGDFLAGHHFCLLEGTLEKTSVVCITGASIWLPEDALALFQGKRVRIFPHIDRSGAGQAAALRWETQLAKAGAAHVECFDLEGIPKHGGGLVEDLNDLCAVTKSTLEELGELTIF